MPDSEKGDAHDFAIEAFRPERAALLGVGLWGRVYDLGDGTVLKVAREHCAGIGNGVEKIANEHAALVWLSGAGIRDIVPLPQGFAAIPPSATLAREGFAMWLRSVKLPGVGLSVETIDRLPAARQSAIAPLRRAYVEAGGAALDERRLTLGIAENALCGAVIGERQGDRPSVASARTLLRSQLAMLASG